MQGVGVNRRVIGNRFLLGTEVNKGGNEQVSARNGGE